MNVSGKSTLRRDVRVQQPKTSRPVPREAAPAESVQPQIIQASQPETEPQSSGFWGRSGTGWGASLILHLAILLCLYGVILQLDRPARALSIDSVMSEDSGDEGFDTILDQAALNPMNIETPNESSPLIDQEVLIDDSERLLPTASSESKNPQGRLGDAEAAGGKAGFFGTTAAGDSFVFIVDSSGSMTGQRFHRAKTELIKSLGRLKSRQKFHVVFFNSETVPMFAPRKRQGLLSATLVNRKKVRRWIDRQQPASTTDPEGALRMALQLKPAVIFLLSDGEFDEPSRCRQAALEENVSGTVIHTIAYMSRDGENTLKAIAEDHRGTFRFVD